ncbi:hypothetical protein BJP36_39450 [Moorena producens JHB]|uniref:Uncharacterized protein n=1 Tax=Moorena producens (strain JHB) TaxID=1454205 RepID=A0A9Q9SUY4_MOOP1|nr:hypothetical protein [Moorena producens]WAN70132.1 hypothetical protein BJP36_39450 [Moorena producens JHB]
MGETTPVAHGGNPQDRTGSPRPRCIAFIKIAFLVYSKPYLVRAMAIIL